MVDVAGAAVQTDRPVLALHLEKDPPHAERPRLVVEQGEHAAAEPAVARLGHQVQLIDAGLAPASTLNAQLRTA